MKRNLSTLLDWIRQTYRLYAASGSSRHLVSAFTLIWLLLAGLGLLSLYAIETNNQRMEKVVREHNVKTALVTSLHGITRERALLVHKMMIIEDIFERDILMLQFRELASSYIEIRNQLRNLPFTEEEQRIFDLSQDKILVSTRLMEDVVSHALDGRIEEAERVLIEEASPAQNVVQDHFLGFIAYQQRLSEEAAVNAQQAYRQAFFVVSALGGMALIIGFWVSVQVIRRSIHAETALALEKERAEVTLHSIGDAVITTDEAGRINHLNAMAERLTGWRNAEAAGRLVGEIYKVLDESPHEGMLDPVGSCLDGAGVQFLKLPMLVARDGATFAIEQSVSPILEKDGRITGAVVVFRDVTKERTLAHELAWQASHDALTDLPNRAEFERRLQDLVDSAHTQHMHHVMLYVDLDQFKLVNDTCGHVAGDELLKQLSALLTAKIRSVDTLARLGGDEFGVLLPGCSVEQGLAIAEKLRQEISEFRFAWEAKNFVVGASIGLVSITSDNGGIASLLSAADTACYMAKDRGRNRIYVHRPQDAEMRRLYGEAEWVGRITRAFEEGRFQLHYQTIVPLQPARNPEYREILLRLIDERGELVPPMAFIPAAERYSLMPTIDRWVIRALLTWLKPQNESAVGGYYSINLSGQSLGDEAFAQFVEDQLALSGIEPGRVCFEVTETAAIANLSQAMRMMSRLQALGCSFSLDDFGSGMSSFAYLKNLPVNSIKIDGAFVRDMMSDSMDHAMVEAIVRIGHVMGLKTIAEYVENDAIRQRLSELGVDYVQGYGVHRPVRLMA